MGSIIINNETAPLAINTVCNNCYGLDNAQITVSASGGTTAYGYAAITSNL
jgi:hypothetical protein